MTPIVLTMELSKSTKNTHVYAAQSEPAAVPTLYVAKSALPTPPPRVLRLTLETQ